MGGACAQTSCGQAYIEWKAIKEMNSRGVYPPNQIQDEVESVWKGQVDKDSTFATKEQTKAIATKVVNSLGARGNGITFDETLFAKQYKKIDPMGLEKNLQSVVAVLITQMMAPPS